MANQEQNSLQWMCDAGVSQEDVKWLEQAPKFRGIAGVEERIRKIQKVAYQGLVATIRPAAYASTSQQ